MDGVDYSKPYIVIGEIYVVSFAFNANRGNRSYYIYIDKLK
jgi:hypothetical protein